MQGTNTIPSLEEFLNAPVEKIQSVAPATLILTNGGTRRRAMFAGISATSNEYASWTRQQMIATLARIFRHGVRHIVTTVLAETNYTEVTQTYRERLAAWTSEGLTGSAALQDYARYGWQVRLIGTESWPELQPVAERLEAETPIQDGPSVWFTVASHPEARWNRILRAAQAQPINTRQEAIRAVYGQDIPPATLFIGSGKPQVFASIVPPLLVGDLQCYWRQHLGYDLDDKTLRTIFYDYAYLRRTWQEDKSGRTEQALRYQDAWQDPPVVGLGTRLGPFWYPAPIASPPSPQSIPQPASPGTERSTPRNTISENTNRAGAIQESTDQEDTQQEE